MRRLGLGLLVAAVAVFLLLAEGAAWLHYGLTGLLLIGAVITFGLSRKMPTPESDPTHIEP